MLPRSMRDQLLVLELIGHVAADDALRQAFDDGGLADAGLADQHRVVLGAAAEHLHDAADFVVAADHRVELALARRFGEVVGVALQRLVLGLGILVGDALRAAHARPAPSGWRRGWRRRGRAAGRRGRCAASAMHSSRCSVETNSSLKRVASSKACSRTWFSGGERYMPGCMPAVLGRLCSRRLASATMASGLHAAFLQHRAHDALLLLRQGDQQVQRDTSPGCRASPRGPGTAAGRPGLFESVCRVETFVVP